MSSHAILSASSAYRWRAAGATNTDILDARSEIWRMMQRESLPTTE